MYKVVLVDDEKYVVKSLGASVNWNEYGFEVVGCAFSGSEAYEMICNLKPDLVFTDIRMPGMSGLELIRNIKEASIETLCIVISGYAEFAYAQKAINYGALGYCLKPFDDNEIISLLKKVKGILESTKIFNEIEIMDLIEESSEKSKDSLQGMLLKCGMEIDPQKAARIIVSIGRNKLKMNDIEVKLLLKIGYDKYAYFIMDSAAKDLNRYMNGTTEEGVKGVGISGKIQSIEFIKAALDEAEIKAYDYFTICGENSGLYSATCSQDKENCIKKLEEYISKNDISTVVLLLENMKGLFSKGQLNIKHAMIIYNNVMSFVCRLNNGYYEDYIYSLDKLARLFYNVQDMLLYLKGLFSEKLNDNTDSNSEKVMNHTFKKILAHVNENFCNDISLQSISMDFNVNANYISQLFKKEVGRTFTEYLSKLRIDFACKLLKTTDMPISEIAEKVGYNDYFYFSRVFKKIKGIPPSFLKKDYS